jgi:hypothetical protein
MRNVIGSTTSKPVTLEPPRLSSAVEPSGFSGLSGSIRSKLRCTAAASMGAPSWKVSPSRILKSQANPSSDTYQLSAMAGCGLGSVKSMMREAARPRSP